MTRSPLFREDSCLSAECQVPTILVVEDDRRLAQVLSRVLSCWGFEVRWANAAEAAVRALERPPAIALLDLHLLDGSGVDLAGELRARYPGLPILLMTGCLFRLQERPNDARYFRQVLSKPLGLPQLKAAIFAALNEDAHANDQATCAC